MKCGCPQCEPRSRPTHGEAAQAYYDAAIDCADQVLNLAREHKGGTPDCKCRTCLLAQRLLEAQEEFRRWT